jgi:hypothetical protein
VYAQGTQDLVTSQRFLYRGMNHVHISLPHFGLKQLNRVKHIKYIVKNNCTVAQNMGTKKIAILNTFLFIIFLVCTKYPLLPILMLHPSSFITKRKWIENKQIWAMDNHDERITSPGFS